MTPVLAKNSGQLSKITDLLGKFEPVVCAKDIQASVGKFGHFCDGCPTRYSKPDFHPPAFKENQAGNFKLLYPGYNSVYILLYNWPCKKKKKTTYKINKSIKSLQ